MSSNSGPDIVFYLWVQANSTNTPFWDVEEEAVAKAGKAQHHAQALGRAAIEEDFYTVIHLIHVKHKEVDILGCRCRGYIALRPLFLAGSTR